MSEEKKWTLVLNKYQRDNLLWLINAIGWPYREGKPAVSPFQAANTGDWIGEIGWQLQDEGDAWPELDEQDRPNISLSELERRVKAMGYFRR